MQDATCPETADFQRAIDMIRLNSSRMTPERKADDRTSTAAKAPAAPKVTEIVMLQNWFWKIASIPQCLAAISFFNAALSF